MGVKFNCQLVEDPFLVMMDSNKKYGYSIVTDESFKTVATLWPAVQEWIKKSPKSWFPKDNNPGFVTDNNGKSYNLQQIYNK